MRKFKKHCAACGKEVVLGTGTYFQGKLIHRKCLQQAKLTWYKLRGKRRR